MENKNQDRKPALLVVDVQNGVVSGAHNRGAVIANINTLITKARSKGIPVIWVQHFDKHMPVGSFAWEVVPELIIESGDQRINKRFNSAFEETNLQEILGEGQITEVVLVGAQTNWCIRATAYAALERGYSLTLISDAHTTEALDLEDGLSISAELSIAELNEVMSWVEYPGRKSKVLKAVEYEF